MRSETLHCSSSGLDHDPSRAAIRDGVPAVGAPPSAPSPHEQSTTTATRPAPRISPSTSAHARRILRKTAARRHAAASAGRILLQAVNPDLLVEGRHVNPTVGHHRWAELRVDPDAVLAVLAVLAGPQQLADVRGVERVQ